MLQGLGLGAVSPLIPILNASGAENLRPKRLVLLFTPDGAPARDWNNVIDWRPAGSETDFTFHEIHAPLAPFRSKIVVPWGLTMTAGGAGEAHAYGMAGLWTASTLQGPTSGADFDGGNGHRTGWGSAASIDQIVAAAHGPNAPYGTAPDDPNQETPYRTVELGVHCLGPTSLNRMIYAGTDAPLHPETNPRSAFDRLLGGISPSGEPPMEDTRVAADRAERRAIVDLLKGDLGRIRGRVGAEDYQKVDAHLEGLLTLERRLDAATGTGEPGEACTIVDPPESTGGRASDYPIEIRNMFDVAVAALSCDVTRVLSLQLSYAFSHVTHTWLGHSSTHHTMSHDGVDRVRELTQIDHWYAQQVVYLLERLDAIPEGDGTLLDNTLVVWGRELGSTAHRMERVPFVLAGRAGGALRSGRWLDLDGRQHAQLLVSVAQMMGVETESIGNLRPNSGGLSELW